MKKETCQHGIVKRHKAFPVPTSKSNSNPIISRFDQPPPTAKLVTKSSSNPINHSKFIEKHGKPRSVEKCGKPRCVGCYFCKSNSKDAGKGTNKIRSCDVGLKHKFVSWKGGDNKGSNGFKYGGISATQVLDQLSKYNDFDDDEEDESEDREDDGQIYGGHDKGEIYGGNGGNDRVVKEEETVNEDFPDVGYFVIPQVDGDEDWCLVGEI